MTLKLTPEQRVAIEAQSPGRPIQVEDEQTKRVYWLVSQEDVPSLWTDYLHHQVEAGLQAIAKGEIVDWNPEAMKERARQAARHDGASR
ncbi:MAG: hypothetical protein C0485_02000 [Pirellula sp.]|nr:hypothetical protein [Pirellula sp.]